jgi:hypothetical protein
LKRSSCGSDAVGAVQLQGELAALQRSLDALDVAHRDDFIKILAVAGGEGVRVANEQLAPALHSQFGRQSDGEPIRPGARRGLDLPLQRAEVQTLGRAARRLDDVVQARQLIVADQRIIRGERAIQRLDQNILDAAAQRRPHAVRAANTPGRT